MLPKMLDAASGDGEDVDLCSFEYRRYKDNRQGREVSYHRLHIAVESAGCCRFVLMSPDRLL